MPDYTASVITSFGNAHFDIYAKQMLTNFVQHWPAQIPILVFLDDDKLVEQVTKLIRPQDAVCVFNNKDRVDFLERNKGKDSPDDYRKQASRFCHKVFALKDAADYWKASTDPLKARYLIWLDADVLITRPVSLAEISMCLPKEGDAVAYLGRKDWPHSECGWLAFDLQQQGDKVIDGWLSAYQTNLVYSLEQWHDSWVFDDFFKVNSSYKRTNLTADKPGMEIWPQSPMAAWSRHYKGPIAKQELGGLKPVQSQQPGMKSQHGNLVIQTKNSLPNETLQRNILENQGQITQWVKLCKPTDEELVVVSAGPMLVAEQLHEEIAAGRRIVAVKHALKPLKEAGIKPWACILLDPRDHVYNFVDNPDRDVIWFVSSQVTPKAVKKLLDNGCNVWGYHAAVGAEEHVYTEKQRDSIISGGSATATRGLFMLDKLGFRNFRLYGYDLCFPDKPNLDLKDEYGQPKHFEVMLDANTPFYKARRGFWSDGQLLAQYQEFAQIIQMNHWKIKAFGHGIVPFLIEAKEVSDLRKEREKDKMKVEIKTNLANATTYQRLLGCKTTTPLWASLRKMLPKTLRKAKKESSFLPI